jgi:signal transduction histidine kinase
MQRRILSVVLPLLVLAAAATGFLIGRGAADRETRTTYLARVNDATALADGAETALRTGQVSAISVRLDRYEEVYGAKVLLFDSELQLLALSSAVGSGERADAQAVAVEALEGLRRDSTPVVYPWDTAPMLVAAPVGNDRRVDGAVVIVWPTERLRSAVTRSWLLLAAALTVGLVLFALLARPLARWVLRPVNDLDETAHSLAEGDFAARVPHHGGPPELRRLADNFNEMADAVSTALQRERVFAADASHHIGSVLTALRLRVELLDGHVDTSGTALHGEVLYEVDRMQEVIDGLLMLARTHERMADADEVDIVAEIDERIAAWRDAAETHGCTLTRIGHPRCTAHVPTGVVGRLMDLLIDNACKYGEGGPITVGATIVGDRSVIAVSDAGPGLSADDLAHAAGRFWRSTEHQNMPGTGLGLAVARELSDACGGVLLIDNVEPHGLRVSVNLPAGRPNAGSKPAPRDATPAAR